MSTRNKIILYPAEIREKIKKWGEEGIGARRIVSRLKKEHPEISPPHHLTVQRFLKKYFISSATGEILNLVSNKKRAEIVARVKEVAGKFGKQLEGHYKLVEKVRKQAEFFLQEESGGRQAERLLLVYSKLFDTHLKLLDRLGFFDMLLKEKPIPGERGVEIGKYDIEKQLATLIKIFERKGIKPRRIK